PARGALLLAPTAAAAAEPPRAHPAVAPETERAWAQAVLAYQGGEPEPLLREFRSAAARASPIGDHVRFLLAQALAQVGDVDGARATAASDYADAGADRLAALEAEGVRVAPLTLEERIDRAERLLRGGVSATASDEAERLVAEVREPSIVLRALRVVAESARKPGRYEI